MTNDFIYPRRSSLISLILYLTYSSSISALHTIVKLAAVRRRLSGVGNGAAVPSSLQAVRAA